MALRGKAPRGRRIGLARALSKLGYCSRSRGFVLVQAGQVSVDGRIRRDPEFPVDLAAVRIAVDGYEIGETARLYLALNKPRGIVTTAADEKGRATVYSLLPPNLPWVGPVGRLDKASEGLLLLTNDSEWAARITDPASHLEKSYHVQIGSLADDVLLRRLRQGVVCGNERLRLRQIGLLRSGKKNSWLVVTLDEGRNRQIRRMLEALQVEVLRLVRVSIGPLQLGSLGKGCVRALTTAEKQSLG